MVPTTILFSLMRGSVLPLLFCTAGHMPDSRANLRERVDLIELNHHHDDLGRHSYDQVIFYEWSPDFRRFHVIAWCLIEGDSERVPTRLPGTREYVVRWHDRDGRVHREIRSRLYRETWSKVDPERANKKLLDERHRLSLLQPPGSVVR